MIASRKLTLDDLWTLKAIGNIALSPDGKRVAFEVHSSDKESNEEYSAIWLLHLDEQGHVGVGDEPRQLTSGLKNDANPVWAPDSRRLLFCSDREEDKRQLWLIDTHGGEARKLTSMLNGVGEATWSPDGQWIAFTAPVGANDEDDLLMRRKTLSADETKKREEKEKTRLRTITKVWYRLDGRGLFDKLSHLFVMPAPATGEASTDAASIRRLTTGDYDHTLPSWTADSTEIGVLCNRAEDQDRSWVKDLWAISRETGEARQLSDGSLVTETYAWSPNGQSVMLVGGKDARIAGGTIDHLYLVSREGGHPEDVTTEIDNHTSVAAFGGFNDAGPYRPCWSADGKHVYFLVTERGCINLYRLDVAQKVSTPVLSGEHLISFLALLPSERGLVLAREQSLQLCELFLLPLHNGTAGELVRLTSLTDRSRSEFLWSEPERMRYRGANGDEVDGWLIRPVGAREGVRYPLAVRIHGGPQSAYGVGLNPYHQYLASEGFAVFYCNPHGSTGCGEAFMREVEGDWGGWDFQDILLGVDECIARGVTDPERLVVSGYSYGGYMSMFLIGHTNRFKAAVPMAGVSNLASFLGTSDIGFWMALQAKGYPWDTERAAYYRERSPLTSAAQVTTPTLFIHPENDLRCPIEQTEQFYMTLKMMGKVPVEFIRAPGAWHIGTAKPDQYLVYWEKMLEWFHKYVEVCSEEYD